MKAQEIQELKLDFLVNLNEGAPENGSKVPNYFIDIPLKERDYKLICHCVRHPPVECDSIEEEDSSQKEKEDEANRLREQGSFAVKSVGNFLVALSCSIPSDTEDSQVQ